LLGEVAANTEAGTMAGKVVARNLRRSMLCFAMIGSVA
jgi:hypothetical protein